MKLILRKNDSSMSILLFIYNTYMVRSTKESLKLSSLIEILKVFDKNETAIRMTLSRAVKAGLLINSKIDNEVSYALTPDGKKAILQWNDGVMNFFKRYKLRSLQWNNKWYFIYAEFTDESKAKKTEFLDNLYQLGFTQLNINTWLSPYHQHEDISNLIKKLNLTDKIIEIYGDMKINKYIDMNEFLNEACGIEILKIAYQNFIDKFSNKLQWIKQMCNEQSFIENGLAFPILHELGISFFNIASDDAVLPRQLLAEWEGDKAALLMTEFRKLLLEATYRYIEKFN